MTGRDLPDGFRIRLKTDLRRADGGATLVGGTPLRVLRLTAVAVSRLGDGVLSVGDEMSRTLARRLLDADIAVPVLAPDVRCRPVDLTVVVPVRDRPDELARALRGLCGDGSDPAVRLLVVDDASVARGAVAAVADRYGAELVTLARNLGPAGARNAGLARVGTPLVAFVDSDVVVGGDVLLRLGAHFLDPAVGLVAPRVTGLAGSPRPRWFERYDEAASSLDLGPNPSAVKAGGAVAYLPAACLVGRTAAVRQVGGFDETMRVAEDVDLVWRLDGAGWRVRYDPAETAVHRARTTVTAWLGRKFVYGTGGALLARRHGDVTAPAAFAPTYALAAVCLVAQRRWSPLVVAGVVGHAAWALDRRLPDTPDRRRLALRLSALGMVWTVRQSADLLLRHWWPVTVAACLVSRRARVAAGCALVLDAALRRRTSARVGPIAWWTGRRLDDLAYGAGLWAGALRSCSATTLRPRIASADLRPADRPAQRVG